MAKGKDVRIRVILECISCVRKGANEESTGISRYSTQKNRHNTPGQLECTCSYIPKCVWTSQWIMSGHTLKALS
ncbi:hypothetical protein ZWY2020_026495 [Hordeum vulgare]|nr:hypothetical protein ZWY2020_026495 [Hordeum vulgare]